jgi:chemotaxis response regulator CheB
VRRRAPDAIIIDTESPSRDTLEYLCLITESCPRPIVMFGHDAKKEIHPREGARRCVPALPRMWWTNCPPGVIALKPIS